MKEYEFVYRCRACGDSFGTVFGGIEVMQTTHNVLQMQEAYNPKSFIISRFESHECSKVQTGFADYIGYREKL